MESEYEVWKPYPEFSWVQGSNFGNVRTLDHYVKDKRYGKRLIKGRVLKQYRQKNGYMYVYFSINGKTVGLRVHRIIAACFLDNPDNLEQVNHIDCNRTNNNVSNLEWCDGYYNSQYREKYGVSATEARGHRIIAINIKTLAVLYFKSQGEAARQLGAYQQNIKDVIKGRRKKHHGYWFTNADEHAVENTRAKFGDKVAGKVKELMEEN